MKIKSILVAGLSLLSLGAFTSCEDMMNTTSKLVMFSEDNTLDQATDSVYSVMGIIGKMQSIADQTVLLGEIRGDLVELTPQASVDLQELAQFKAGKDNFYNAAEKYYAVINNCNFYLAHVDTSLKKRNEYVFMREFAAVKTFRAWTYLQLASIYGTVPFITEPVLTEADANKNYPMYGVKELCNYFVDDLLPYVNLAEPGYGAINGLDSRKFFIPTRVVLGDFCLWAERYLDAARFYHDYLTVQSNIISTSMNQTIWNNLFASFSAVNDSYTGAFESVGSAEIISYIPMESITSEQGYSDLGNVFNSTSQNNYFNKVTPSRKLVELSTSQTNCIVYSSNNKLDTLFAPERNYSKPSYVGDLRLPSVYKVTNNTAIENNAGGNPTSSNLYSTTRQAIHKFTTGHVTLYRRGQVYLRFAEAMNRAGFPESAFAVLKYGLYPSNITKYINSAERASAGNLLTFSQYSFNTTNTLGIHSRGAGDASANKYYVIPKTDHQGDTIKNASDSIDFVEELICNETALETSFEGYRFFDLVRMGLHRNDQTWLAEKIAGRKGAANYDADLYLTLTNKKNWYLPLK